MKIYSTFKTLALPTFATGLLVFSTLYSSAQCNNTNSSGGQPTTSQCNGVGVNERFESGTGGFSITDFRLSNKGTSDDYLESTNLATTGGSASGLKSLQSPSYTAGAAGTPLNVRAQLKTNLKQGYLNSYTLRAIITNDPSAVPIQLCAGGQIGNADPLGDSLDVGITLCLALTTPAQLAGKSFKFEWIFDIRGSSPSSRLRFDDFGTNVSPAPIILPVTFIGFEGKRTSGGTLLSWTVGEEIDVKGYGVERSTNGSQFSSIGFVEAGKANPYTFTDAQPAQGVVFYRIKSMDLNGEYQYSVIISVKNGMSAIVLKAFPNPARNELTLQHNAADNQALITVNTLDGKVIKRLRPQPGAIQTKVSLLGMQAGMYMLQYDNGKGGIESLKVFKL